MKNFLKTQGAFILSELNDLKRTVESAAVELGWAKEEVEKIIKGDASEERVNKFIEDCAEFYPINKGDLVLTKNDCEKGIKLFTVEESKKSFRVFSRQDKKGERTPYYEYRDTAISKLSFYRPEWIKQLRVVSDNDPNNPDVVYNNGHFMHQVTFFVGPVNFYYEIDGKRYCEEMNTGDSNYITPFYPHSFASRDESKEAYILAVTFGAGVKRALNELYHLGKERSIRYTLSTTDRNKKVHDLLDFHLNNSRMSRSTLQEILEKEGLNVNILDENLILTEDILKEISKVLKIDPTDFIFLPPSNEKQVIVKKGSENDHYFYPSSSNQHYKIWPLAMTSKLPFVKSLHITVLKTKTLFSPDFCSGLHTYIFNYGESSCKLNWVYEKEQYTAILRHGDSIYIQPFIEHEFTAVNEEEKPSELYCVSIPGRISFETQKELSELGDIGRTVFETHCWFN